MATGHVPDMPDAAASATVIYDPRIELDTMHAALFTCANGNKLWMPYFGIALDVQMMRLEILYPLLVSVGSETSVPAEYHRLHRMRRRDSTYLRALLGDVEDVKRCGFTKAICDHAAAKLLAPRFKNVASKLQHSSPIKRRKHLKSNDQQAFAHAARVGGHT